VPDDQLDPEHLRQRRQRRVLKVVGTLAAAAVVAIVLIATSKSSDTRPPLKAGKPVPGAAQVARELRGIPQHGVVLGNPRAKVTAVEFLDPQCPFCRQFAQSVFPGIVRDYVRTGKVRWETRTLGFLGNDSVRGAEFLNAAGLQNKQYDVQGLLYANQGEENSGYLTNAFLRQLGAAVPGFDPAAAFAAMPGPRVQAINGTTQTMASRYGVKETPTILVGPTGGTLEPVDADSVTDRGPYAAALDARLRAAG
jgi:protein-disulfide isomerase